MNKLIVRAGTPFFTAGSEPGYPQSGLIGDIQSNSESTLRSVTPTAFAFDQNIVYSIAESSKYDTYLLKAPGAKLIGTPTTKALPYQIGSNWWYYVDGNLKAYVTNPGALLFSFSTTRPTYILRTKNAVCPSATLVSVSGCYSCTAGSVAIVKIKSLCKEGFVSIVCSNPTLTLAMTTVFFNTSFEEIAIRFYPSVSDVNTLFVFRSGTNEVSVAIKFTAVEENYVPNTTDASGSSHITKPKTGWQKFIGFFKSIGKFFDDAFKGRLNWWKYIIFSIVIIIVIAVIVLVSIPTIQMIVRRIGRKVKVI